MSLKGIWKFLGSFALSIILMCILVFTLVLFAFLPQEANEKGVAYTGWGEGLLYVVLALLIVNISVCNCSKIIGLIQNSTPLKTARWGVVIFHLAIILVFGGGLWGRLNRFEGYLELGEGQHFTEQHHSYLNLKEGFLFGENHAGFIIRLDKVDAFTNYADRTKDYACKITLKDGEKEILAYLKPNQPFSYKGFTIYQSKYFGNALLFEFTDRMEKKNTGYVNLPLADEKQEDEVSHFLLPGAKTQVSAILHKLDLSIPREMGNRPSSSHQLTLYLKKSDGRMLKEKVAIGETLNTEEGKLVLLDIRKWSGLTVVKDFSKYPVFLGFIIVVIGLLCKIGTATI